MGQETNGNPLWYQDAIIYELHVRAFADSNGDGIGDFPGLLGKLDYLQDLGVTALWLLPFYPSPLRDDGYDIADYTDVNPSYGTLADFRAFLDEAHRRGLRVITELVLNHTSDQHPWFQRARHAPKGSPERDFYVWNDTPDRYSEARIIFKDFEASNWTWDPVAGAYYWHRFYAHQPDLNYDNPAVQQAAFDVLDFWLGMGVDGLRLDAVPYLFEREGTNCENLPETHAFLKQLRRHVDEKFRDRMLLAEANQWPEDAVAYFGQGDECHMAFHFPLMPRLFMAVRMENRFPVLDILQQTPPIPLACQWAIFLRNHDELTLEMVTDEDRDYMYRIYAQDPQARINLGIRRRLAPLLENHRGKIELMNGLLLSLPGTPVLYYGDEIGMGDNIYLGDRNGVRTPMQWSAERNAGFSRANPQRLYLPVIIDPEYQFEAVNVEAQQNNPHSLLWWTKRLLALRRRHRAFGRGGLEFVAGDNAKVLAFVRRWPDSRGPDSGVRGQECILVVANLSRFPQHVNLDLGAFQGLEPVEMLGRTRFPAVGPQPYPLTLGSHSFYWFSLEPQKAALPLPPAGELPTVQVTGSWDRIFAGQAAAVEEVLPAYLQRCPWFRGRERTIDAVSFDEVLPVSDDPHVPRVVLLSVTYQEGEPETYLLPLAFAAGAEAEHLAAELPQAPVCRLEVEGGAGGEKAGILYDPLGEKRFSRALLAAVLRQYRLKRAGGELLALALPPLAQLRDPADPLPEATPLRADHSHTSLVYGDRLFLKVFRRIEEGINPELELGRALQDKAGYRNVPPVAGFIEFRRRPAEPMTLAVLEGFVPNQGDAWRHTLDALGRYYEQGLTHRGKEHELSLPDRPLVELVQADLPASAPQWLGSYLESARLLGQRVADFHRALAWITDEPAFAPEPFTTLYQQSLYQSLRAQARQALELLRQRLPGLPEPVQGLARQLLERESDLLRQARRMVQHKIAALRTRGHGDLHLGQVLYTGKDFVLIDLEGSSQRHLSDRRRKRSPLRDVASMLRSFHYATHAAALRGGIRREDLPALAPWQRFWRLWVSAAFLKAYLATAGLDGFLPQRAEELDILLTSYRIKRAAQELRDDLVNRPDRVEVPIEGLLNLLEPGAAG